MSRLPIDLGAGAAEVLRQPGPGTVVAVYRRAAYLRLPGGIVALVDPEVPLGPLWIRAGGGRGLELQQPVVVGDGWLEVAGQRLPVHDAEIWWGALPDPASLRAGVPLALDVLAGPPPSSLLDDSWRTAWRQAEAAIQQGDLPDAAAVLGGLGPGLTPAGDDALAGILLAHRTLAGAGAEHHLLAVARSAVTTDLSAALLAWAARGQAVEPVHDLLGAIAGGDGPAATAATHRIASLGASSGADLLLGLRLGFSSRAGDLVTRTGPFGTLPVTR